MRWDEMWSPPRHERTPNVHKVVAGHPITQRYIWLIDPVHSQPLLVVISGQRRTDQSQSVKTTCTEIELVSVLFTMLWIFNRRSWKRSNQPQDDCLATACEIKVRGQTVDSAASDNDDCPSRGASSRAAIFALIYLSTLAGINECRLGGTWVLRVENDVQALCVFHHIPPLLVLSRQHFVVIKGLFNWRNPLF